MVAGIVLLSAGVAASLSAAPTGNDVPDLLLRAALAAAAAAAGAAATRTAWLVAAGLVTAAAGGPALGAGFAALGAGAAVARPGRGASRRTPVVGAAISGTVANVGLSLVWPDRFGATAVVAGAAVGVLAVSALRRTNARARVRVAVGAAIALAAVGIASAAALGPLWTSRADADAAFDAGVAGIASARQGDSTAAAEHFERAGRLLDGVRGTTQQWWSRPARAVPVLAQHLEAVEVAVAAASDLAAAGRTTAREVDIERLRPRQGRVDVAALASYERPLAETADVLADVERRLAAIDDRWLVTPLRRRVRDVQDRVIGAHRDNLRALDATRHVPALLGAGGQTRWFVAVFTPSELRGGGGLVGNWGILTATDGRLELPVFERIASLYRDEHYTFDVHPEWNTRYIEPYQLFAYPQNMLASPHFPYSAEATRQLADQAGVGPVDGVIALDPFAMAALLRLTGPVTVDGWPEPLTADNAAEILLYRQYLTADDPDRPDFLHDTTRQLFDRLTTGELPSPPTIADALGPMVEQRRIQLYAFDDAATTYLEGLGATAELQVPAGDAIGLVTHNAAPSKLDWFLRRSLTYDVEIDPDTGETTATVEVRLRNTATADLPGAYFGYAAGGFGVGHNRQLVSLYTPMTLDAMTVDGSAVTPARSIEREHNVYETIVDLAPGAEAVLRFELGRDGSPQRDRYRLDVERQPTTAPDDLAVTVNGSDLFGGDLTAPMSIATSIPVVERR